MHDDILCTYETITNGELLQELKKHKNYLCSKEQWDGFAEEMSYPDSKYLSQRFKSWGRCKAYVGVGDVRSVFPRLQKEEIIEMMDFYKEHLSSQETWDQMAIKFNLPSSDYIVRLFGNWTNLRIELGLEERKTTSWNDEELIGKISDLARLLGVK